MPIVHKEAPAGLMETLSEGLSTIMQSREAVTPMGLAPGEGITMLEDHEASTPHPVYTVDRKDILAGKLLSAATQVGWRVLILSNDEAVGAGTVAMDESGGLTFGTLNQGPLVSRTIGSISASEGSKAVASDDYELRYLEIRPLYFAAIWLHGTSGDIIIPLEDNDAAGVPAFSEQSEETILKMLQDAAALPGAIPETYEDR